MNLNYNYTNTFKLAILLIVAMISTIDTPTKQDGVKHSVSL